MSEYQYYEFQAIDEPLDDGQMAKLRAISTRATITPTRFANVYNWGDLKADPQRLVAKYFDAFVYVANWGTQRFMLRIPRQLVDEDAVLPYSCQENAVITTEGEHLLLDFWSEEEGGDWEDGEGWLSSLVPLRADILGGDLRCLYLGWLLAAQNEYVADEELEPPVPPGLDEQTAPLGCFAQFLRIDPDLIEVAAEGAPSGTPAAPSHDELAAWIGALPESEKDALLLRVAEGEGPTLRWEVLKRFRQDTAPPEAACAGDAQRRTAAQLLERRDARATERQRRLAQERAEKEARLAEERARAREKHLDTLAGRETEFWRCIEALIRTRQPKKYDQAVRLLADLRDLAGRQRTSDDFQSRLQQLRERHRRKDTLLQRLDRAGLGE